MGQVASTKNCKNGLIFGQKSLSKQNKKQKQQQKQQQQQQNQ